MVAGCLRKGLAIEMGAYNGEKAKRYDWRRVIDQIEELYRSVLGDGAIRAQGE